MGLTPAWYGQTGTILQISSSEAWDWSDVHSAVTDCLLLMDSVSQPVDLIINLDGNNQLPPGNPMLHFNRASTLFFAHPRSHRLVITNVSTLGRTAADLFLRIYSGRDVSRKVYLVSTMQEALDLLATAHV